MDFKERLRKSLLFNKKHNWITNGTLITAKHLDNKEELFFGLLDELGLNRYEENNDTYDYAIINEKELTPVRFYNLLKKHNEKMVIINSNKALKDQKIINLLEGAVCSSPDSVTKWPVRLENKKDFLFLGKLIVLTTYSLDDLKNNKKYTWLLRDCVNF